MNNSVLARAIIKVTGVAWMAAFPYFLHAASFDCAKATAPIEKLICSDETTSKLDADLASAYKSTMEKAENKDELKQQQRTWLKEKRNACKDADCLMQVYQARIAEFNTREKSSVPVSEKVKPITENVVSDSTTKKPVTIKFVYGDSYPICKPYLDMLNAAQYTELPACERKILSQFPQFKGVNWIEMTDKKVIEKELTELIDLEYFARQKVDTPNHKGAIWALKKSLDKNLDRYFYFKIDVNGDDIDEIIYKKEYLSVNAVKYQKCTKSNIFHIKNSIVDKEFIRAQLKNKYYNYTNPYRAFNYSGSSEVFLHQNKFYVSSWAGEFIDGGANLNIYGFGNNKICGFLIN